MAITFATSPPIVANSSLVSSVVSNNFTAVQTPYNSHVAGTGEYHTDAMITASVLPQTTAVAAAAANVYLRLDQFAVVLAGILDRAGGGTWNTKYATQVANAYWDLKQIYQVLSTYTSASTPQTVAVREAATGGLSAGYLNAIGLSGQNAVPMVAQLSSSSTVNIQQWKDGTGTTKASMANTGVLTAIGFVGPVTGNTTGTHTGAVVGNADTATLAATATVATNASGLTPGAAKFTALADGYATANGTGTVVVTAPQTFDASGLALTPTAYNFTPGTAGSDIWWLVYYNPIAQAYATRSDATKPNAVTNTIPCCYVFQRSGTSTINQTNTGSNGYVVDCRSPWLLMNGPAAPGGSGAYAASGANSDITSLNYANLVISQPSRISNLYFGTPAAGGTLGLNVGAQSNAWLTVANTGTNKLVNWHIVNTGSSLTNLTAVYGAGGGYSYPVILNTINYQVVSDGTGTSTDTAYQLGNGNTALGPYGVGLIGVYNTITVGSTGAGAVAAYGSVLGVQSGIYVKNAQNKSNEYCPYVGITRFDQTSGIIGHGWAGDIHVQGAVGVQQEMFGGWHITTKYYYNGSPFGTGVNANYDYTNASTTNMPSTALSIIGIQGALGVSDTAHGDAAATYKMDIGLYIGGSAADANAVSTTTAPLARSSFGNALQIGGWGGNYGATIKGMATFAGGVTNYSHLGNALVLLDYDGAGLTLGNRFAGTTGTAVAIVQRSNAGNSIFGTLVAKPTSADTASYVQVGDKPFNNSLQSAYFSVNAGILATAVNSNVNVATFGINGATGDVLPATDNAWLRIWAYRTATATTAASTTFGLVWTAATGAQVSGIYFASTGFGVGANNVTPAGTLHVLGDSTARRALFVQAIANTVNDVARFDASATSGGQVVTIDLRGHINVATSTAAPASSGLGTNVTSVTATGTDHSGKIVVVTSGAMTAAGDLATMTFAGAGFGTAPNAVLLVPADSLTWALAGNAQVSVPTATLSATVFHLKAGSVGAAAGTYTYYYMIL